MRYLKMLSLSVLAAAAVTAFVGSGSAAAETTLCAVAESPCPGGSGVGVGSEFKAVLQTGTSFVKTAAGGMMQSSCSQAELTGKVETATTPQIGLSTVKFLECDATGVSVLKTGQLVFHWDSESNASVTWQGFEVAIGSSNSGTSGESSAACVYGGEATQGITLTGGSPALLEMTTTVTRISGNPLICSATQVWHAQFEVTSPKSLFASQGL
jgi:hypothetical protein